MAYKYVDPRFNWSAIADQIHGNNSESVMRVLHLRKVLNARIAMPNGLLVSLCRSGDPKTPFCITVKRDRPNEEVTLAPRLSHVVYEGDSEWMVGMVQRGCLAKTLKELAGITLHEAREGTRAIHNVLGPPRGNIYLF